MKRSKALRDKASQIQQQVAQTARRDSAIGWIIFVAAAVVLVVLIGYALGNTSEPVASDTDSPETEHLFSALFDAQGEFRAPDRIVAKSPGRETRLELKQGLWVIATAADALADQDMVRDFLTIVRGSKRQKPAATVVASFANYGLEDGSAVATQYEISAGSARVVFSVHERMLRFEQAAAIYQVPGLYHAADVETWLAPRVAVLSAAQGAQVKEIRFSRGYSVQAKETGNLKTWHVSNAGEVAAGRIDSLLFYARGVPLRSVTQAPSREMHTVTLVLADGQSRSYRIGDAPAQGSSTLVPFQRDGDTAVYMIGGTQARQLHPSLEALQGKEEVERYEEPEKVEIELMIIGYSGLAWPATAASQGRSHTQAQALASNLIAQLRNGADFVTLATEYSDYRDHHDATRAHLRWGPHPRGAKWPADVEKVAFGLGMNELCERAIETAYGLYIIRRVG